jgi:hypothetical protein
LVAKVISSPRFNFEAGFYYTSPPFQSSNPTDEEKIRYAGFQKFIDFLERQDSFEIKFGKTEKRGDNQYSQKMVDVL